MTRYKLTRMFILEAEKGEESLEWEKIVEAPARRQARRNGWVDSAKEQLGNRSSK